MALKKCFFVCLHAFISEIYFFNLIQSPGINSGATDSHTYRDQLYPQSVALRVALRLQFFGPNSFDILLGTGLARGGWSPN